MKPLSLKLRLIFSFLFVAGAVWAASGLLAWAESREQMDEFFDSYQLMLARQLSTADWKNTNPATQKSINHIINDLNDDGEEDDEALGLAVFDANGKMIFNDNKHGRLFQYNPHASGFINQPLGRKKKLWRIVWIKSIDKQYTIAIGQEMEYRDEAALEMVEETFIPWSLGLMVLLIVMIALINREFMPLKKIAENLANRESDNLAPLKNDNIPQEVAPLVQAMNGLFARIDGMLQRERSFIADSAHELRSPLTALKVQLDVAELAGDDQKMQQTALQNLREGIERSSRLVEQMLALSKLESSGANKSEEELNWPLILDNVVLEHKEMAQLKNIAIKTDCRPPLFLQRGQGFLWSLLLRNLLDNAIRYSQEDAVINIELDCQKLKVSNDKTAIDDCHLPRLGERFFRPAGQKTTGSGLGLSIVEKIAALHNCQTVYHYEHGVFSVIIAAKES